MKRAKLALLAAAAVMVVMPAMAQDRDGRHGGRQNRSLDGGERSNDRPTPPQAIGQQPRPQPQVSAPSAPPQQQQRGNWGGGNRFSPEQRAQWQGNRGQQDRGGVRPTPPQAINPVQQQDRGQWTRNEGQRGDPALRNGQNGGRSGDGRWNRDNRNGGDNRWNNDNRNAGDNRWNNDNRRNDGRRWDNNDNSRNGDRRWDNNGNRRDDDRRWNNNGNGRGDNDRRWDRNGRGNGYRPNLNWRNDHRYDWRGWRDTHRNVFHRGRYNAPYNYGYRSVYRGFFLEPLFYSSNYWLSDPYEYRLPPVEWPYRWVRYYDDALLVDATSGEVVDVIEGFFF